MAPLPQLELAAAWSCCALNPNENCRHSEHRKARQKSAKLVKLVRQAGIVLPVAPRAEQIRPPLLVRHTRQHSAWHARLQKGCSMSMATDVPFGW
ncbi:MAG: hypothetical protein ACREP9_20185 [Candidatus Dormibacteraceae bacterium]